MKKVKGEAVAFTFLNLISFIFMIIGGIVMLGSDFFYWVGSGFNYAYEFLFHRPIDTKTFIVIAILALSLVCFFYWIIHDLRKDKLHLYELMAPVAAIICPFVCLSAFRGNSIGIFEKYDQTLVVIELVFTAIYAITTLILWGYSFCAVGSENRARRKELKEAAAKEVVAEPVVEEKPAEEEPVVEPVEETKEETVEEPVEEVVEEPVVEEVSEEPVEEEKPAAKKVVRKPFTEKMAKASGDIKDTYNILKNELLSYGVKSRVSHGGDTFRLRKVEYAKITLVGKNLKLYLATNPAKYNNTTIPVRDESSKKCFADTPTMIRVRSALSVKRAKMMIADLMEEKQLPQGEVGNVDFAKQLKAKQARKAKI